MSTSSAPGQLPPLAYVLLWFPLSSETFIFREVEVLRSQGLDVRAYTMYGKADKGLSHAMQSYSGPVWRLGFPGAFRILGAFLRRFAKQPRLVWQLMRLGLFRKMRNAESLAENSWCFFAGFLLAEQCQKDKIGLIHSAWANGPATAAWIASRLSGIPFAFTGRAGDIYPQDGLLSEKAADALFIRTNNAANVEWLSRFCPESGKDKVRLIYNGLTFPDADPERVRKPQPPYNILAVGRFARTKGFPELFTAMARLKRENFPVRLTLVGDGAWRGKLLRLRKRLGLEEYIDMPGFVPNDQLKSYMQSHDLLVVPSVIHSNGDRDGIPNVIMEACSVGLPVVATDVCGISEVITPDATGYLVHQRKPSELADAIRLALENPEKTCEMANAAARRVKSMFDTQKNSAELCAIYRESLS